MSNDKLAALLGGWAGYRIGTVGRYAPGVQGPTAQVWIELLPLPGRGLRCSGCGKRGHQVHDTVERWVRDLPLMDAQTHLLVHRRRVLCPRCGPKLERLSWLDRYARVTRRLAENVAKLCALLPIRHVAAFYGLHWETVKQIDRQHLEAMLGPPDLSAVTAIVMDEFAIHKGQRYATVIADPFTRRVLWVGRGNSREAIRPFFERLGPDGRARLEAVVMDMNGAYEAEVRAWCPAVPLVYDQFHVVAKYGLEVVDQVRREEVRRLANDAPARQVVKSSRWLLLRNKQNLRRRADRLRLAELLKANRALFTVYVLKDDLKHLWDFRYPKAALRFWNQWYGRARQSGLAPLQRFAERLKPYLPGILAHCQWPLHTSLLEGINNKIKVIKRMAYGFRDDDYFFLKIRAAFPGIP